MIDQNQIKDIVQKVMLEFQKGEDISSKDDHVSDMNSTKSANHADNIDNAKTDSDEILPDICQEMIQKVFFVPNAANKERYLRFKEKTPARLGIWRSGTRMNTQSYLRFRADHAVAQDAVFTSVNEDFLKEMNLKSYQTMCRDKDEFITRPDLGRIFSEEIINEIKKDCKNNPSVQIFVADGLSSTAIETNVKDTLPALLSGLQGYGIDTGTPFFVKFGRVGSEDSVAKALNAEVVCVLIGERPGLATAESMSCYTVYKAYPGIPEAKRTVLSNIHKHGTPAAEAGAHMADVIKKILEEKASGVDLKL